MADTVVTTVKLLWVGAVAGQAQFPSPKGDLLPKTPGSTVPSLGSFLALFCGFGSTGGMAFPQNRLVEVLTPHPPTRM